MRFPVEIAAADLEDRAAVEKAARGCDAIVHLGVGERAGRETRPIVEAARALGIRRFIHMSSAAVYGARIPASVEKHQDRTLLRATGESYADEKAAAERVVLAARELDAVLLRPHIVYGPGMRFTGDLIELLRRGEVYRGRSRYEPDAIKAEEAQGERDEEIEEQERPEHEERERRAERPVPVPVSAAWIRTPRSAPSVPPRNCGVT